MLNDIYTHFYALNVEFKTYIILYFIKKVSSTIKNNYFVETFFLVFELHSQ